MNHSIPSIAKREFYAFFFSLVAYVVIGVFLLVVGWFFFKDYFLWQQVSMARFFQQMPLILSLTIPAITMRSFSDEFRSGSFEILKTLPITLKDIIIGKFLGSWYFGLCLFVPTLLYLVTVGVSGHLDLGPVVGGYLATALLVAQLTAIGLFASSLSKNQIVGYIIGVAISFPLAILNSVLFFLPPFLQGILGYLSIGSHFVAISQGVLDFRDILYFCAFSAVALTATYLVIEEK